MDRLLSRVAILMLVLSLALNLCLAWALQGSRGKVTRLQESLSLVKDESRLQAGAEMRPLSGEDALGNPLTLDYRRSQRETLLYVFSSDCGWCARNLDNIRSLARAIEPRYQVLGVSLAATSLRERAKDEEMLGFPVLYGLSTQAVAEYRLGTTPQTLLISSEGKLLRNWGGAFAKGLDRTIEEYFAVRLPGLLQPPSDRSTAVDPGPPQSSDG